LDYFLNIIKYLYFN